MLKTTLPWLGAAMLGGALLAGPAMAQSSGTTPGTTSGPATGSPATLGTGGNAPITQHQSSTVRDGGGPAIQNEQKGQAGGDTSMKPGMPDAGAGHTPAKGATR